MEKLIRIQCFAFVKLLIVASFLITALLTCTFNPAWANAPVKVGIFQNRPIVYYDDGPKGLFVEVLDYTAQKENWKIEYVPCEFKDCLNLLKANELDLMTSLGESPERLEHFAFSKESIWTFWGTVYSNDIKINSILDLKGKKIGVRRKNKITRDLKKLLTDFNIPVEYVAFDNYESAFKALYDKTTDAVAVNNTYAFSKQKGAPLLHKTPIAFNPFSAYFAISKTGGRPKLLGQIDKHVKALKSDPSSMYYAFQKKWFGSQAAYWTGKRIGIISAIILSITVVFMAFWRYRSVVKINAELTYNIAERKRTEEKLQAAHNRLIDIIEFLPNPTFVVDQDRRVIAWNRAIEEMTNVPKEKMLHKAGFAYALPFYGKAVPMLLDMISDVDAGDPSAYDNLERENGCIVAEAFLPLLNDGQGAYVMGTAANLLDNHGNSIGAIETIHDITERKKAEEALKMLTADLSAKNDELEQVVYVASHDLRSPLVNIDGYSRELSYAIKDLRLALAEVPIAADTLQTVTAILEQDIPEALRFIQTSASKMDTLLTGLLRLSRSGRATLTVEPINMNRTISKVIDATEFQIREADVKIEVADLPPCQCDVVQVNQILSNFLDNALKYLDSGRPGVIGINGRIEKDRSVYCVEDNGIGIAPDHLGKIFEIFHRLDPENGEGEGLGLTIVKRIVERMNGNVWVESDLGSGSRFFVALPTGVL